MTRDIKGFVATPCKDPFFVADKVSRALDQFLLNHGQGGTEPVAGRRHRNPIHRPCRVAMAPSIRALSVQFAFEGEDRTLWVHFDCDEDYDDLVPACLVICVTPGNGSDVLMRTALRALSMLGRAFLDAGTEPPEAVLMLPPTYASACAQRLEVSSPSTLQDWYSLLRRGQLRGGDAETVIGLSEVQIRRVLDLPYREGKSALDQLLPAKAGPLRLAP